jgi:hypothetical protein
MRRLLVPLIAAVALALPATAGAHDGLGDWDITPYCGFADGGFKTVVGGFGGVTFDRYVSTRIVTPGATPWAPNQWHAVFHTYDHFYYGWRYRDERLCRWAYW